MNDPLGLSRDGPLLGGSSGSGRKLQNHSFLPNVKQIISSSKVLVTCIAAFAEVGFVYLGRNLTRDLPDTFVTTAMLATAFVVLLAITQPFTMLNRMLKGAGARSTRSFGLVVITGLLIAGQTALYWNSITTLGVLRTVILSAGLDTIIAMCMGATMSGSRVGPTVTKIMVAVLLAMFLVSLSNLAFVGEGAHDHGGDITQQVGRKVLQVVDDANLDWDAADNGADLDDDAVPLGMGEAQFQDGAGVLGDQVHDIVDKAAVDGDHNVNTATYSTFLEFGGLDLTLGLSASTRAMLGLLFGAVLSLLASQCLRSLAEMAAAAASDSGPAVGPSATPLWTKARGRTLAIGIAASLHFVALSYAQLTASDVTSKDYRAMTILGMETTSFVVITFGLAILSIVVPTLLGSGDVVQPTYVLFESRDGSLPGPDLYGTGKGYSPARAAKAAAYGDEYYGGTGSFRSDGGGMRSRGPGGINGHHRDSGGHRDGGFEGNGSVKISSDLKGASAEDLLEVQRLKQLTQLVALPSMIVLGFSVDVGAGVDERDLAMEGLSFGLICAAGLMVYALATTATSGLALLARRNAAGLAVALPSFGVSDGAGRYQGSSMTSHVRIFLRTVLENPDSRSIFFFFSLNLAFMFVEFFYGIWTNSLGLISDAFHMLFDCAAILIGLIASVISKWPKSRQFSFGYARIETISGFTNGILLCFVAFFVFSEAISRVLEPEHVRTEKLLAVSVAGLLVNLVGVFAFGHGHSHGGGGHGHSHGGGGGHSHGHSHGGGGDHGHSHGGSDHGHGHGHGGEEGSSGFLASLFGADGHNENMQGVFLHVLADALGSVGVIISTLLIENFGWLAADPICSMFIAALIFSSVLPLLGGAYGHLTHQPDSNLRSALQSLTQEALRTPGVMSVEDGHLWQHSEDMQVGTLKLMVDENADEQKITSSISALAKSLGVGNFAVQLEKQQFAQSKAYIYR
eukprot:Clim_evm61s214 gene=Clim_evmTU61s214